MNDFPKQYQFSEKQSKLQEQSSDDEEFKQQQIESKDKLKNESSLQMPKYSQIQKIKEYISFMFSKSKLPLLQKFNKNKQLNPNKITSILKTQQIYNLQKELLKYTKINNLENKQQQKKFYKNFNKSYQIYQKSIKLLINQKIIKQKRFSISNKFNKQLQVKKIYHSKHYEIVSVKIQLLEYETEVRILNKIQKSPLHSCAKISCYGGFGNIYFLKVFDQELAIKCIPFNKINNWIQTTHETKSYIKSFISILKQYFFNLLFSELEIGPKIKTIGGFDLIFNDSCVQFASQICENSLINDSNQLEQDLKHAIKIFHSLKIVHRDIKPTNIMYSNKFNKNVFIDFGVSQVIQETVGYKKISSFIGTTSHCTQQLLSLIRNIKGYADLYFNDLYALKISISDFTQAKKLQSKIKYNQISAQQFLISENSLFILITTLKYKLYYSNLNKTSHPISEQQSQQIYFLFKLINRQIEKLTQNNFSISKDEIDIEILQFFYELNTINSIIIKYFQQQIHQNIRQLDQFINLKHFIRKYSERKLFVYYVNQSKKNIFLFYEWFYESLFVEYKNELEDKQKIILTLINNKKLMEEYLQKRLKNFNQLFMNQQSLLINKNFQVFCMIVLKYCTMTNNKFGIEMGKKISLCQKIIEKLFERGIQRRQSRKNKLNQFSLELIFKCIQQRFQSLARFFQFFLIFLWKNIDFKHFNSQVFLQLLINLCLLGYPTYSKQARQYMIELMIGSKNLQKTQKIILYWQVKILFMTFDTYLQQRSEENFYLEKWNKINNESDAQKHYKIQKSQFLPQEKTQNHNITLKERFIRINYQFYSKINFNIQYIAAYKNIFTQLKQIIEQNELTNSTNQRQSLQSSYFLPIHKNHNKTTNLHSLSVQTIKKWLILSYYIVYIFDHNNFRLNLQVNKNYIRYQVKSIISQYSRQIYYQKQNNFFYFLILSTLQTVINIPDSIKTNLYLQKLSQKINEPTISLRLSIQYQLNIILVKQTPQQNIQKLIQILDDFQKKFSYMNYYQINNLLKRINIDTLFKIFGINLEEKLEHVKQDLESSNNRNYYLLKLYLNLYYKIFTIALQHSTNIRQNEKTHLSVPMQLKIYQIHIYQIQTDFEQLRFHKKFFIKLIQLGQRFIYYKQFYPILMKNILTQVKHKILFNQLVQKKQKYFYLITYFYQRLVEIKQIYNIFKTREIDILNKILEELLRQQENLQRNFIEPNHNQNKINPQLLISQFFQQFVNLENINSQITNLNNQKKEIKSEQSKSINLSDTQISSFIKLPSIILIIQYYEYKLIKSDYDPSQCIKFMKLIQFLKQRQFFNTYLFQKINFLQQILLVHILLFLKQSKIQLQLQQFSQIQEQFNNISNVSYNGDSCVIKISDLRQIIEQSTRIIKNMPSIMNIEILRQNIHMIFSLKEQNKNRNKKQSMQNQELRRQNLKQVSQQSNKKSQLYLVQLLEHWKPLYLINQLYSSIQSLDEYDLNMYVKDNPYMALVYCLCYTNNFIPYKMSKLFIKIIIKSLQYLDKYSKNIIQNRIYQIMLLTLINQQKQVYLNFNINFDHSIQYQIINKLHRKKRYILVTKIFRKQQQHFISINELRKIILMEKSYTRKQIICIDNKITRYLQNNKNIQK